MNKSHRLEPIGLQGPPLISKWVYAYLVRLAIIVLFAFRLYKPHVEDFQVRYLAYLFARWATLTSENIAYHIFFNLSCKVLLTRFNNIFKWQLVKFKRHKFLRSDSRILLSFPWTSEPILCTTISSCASFWLSFSFLSSLSCYFCRCFIWNCLGVSTKHTMHDGTYNHARTVSW